MSLSVGRSSIAFLLLDSPGSLVAYCVSVKPRSQNYINRYIFKNGYFCLDDTHWNAYEIAQSINLLLTNDRQITRYEAAVEQFKGWLMPTFTYEHHHFINVGVNESVLIIPEVGAWKLLDDSHIPNGIGCLLRYDHRPSTWLLWEPMPPVSFRANPWTLTRKEPHFKRTTAQRDQHTHVGWILAVRFKSP